MELACFGPKWPKTGHFGCRASCVAGRRVGLPSAFIPRLGLGDNGKKYMDETNVVRCLKMYLKMIFF